MDQLPARSGSNLRAAGLSSGLGSLRTQGRARRRGAGPPRTGLKSSGSRRVFGFRAFIPCSSVQALGPGMGTRDQAGVAINNTDRRAPLQTDEVKGGYRGATMRSWGAGRAGTAGREGEARPPGPHCHLPRPFPAPAPATLGRKEAHSQWGPVRVLKGWWPSGLPPAPSLDADFSILG